MKLHMIIAVTAVILCNLLFVANCLPSDSDYTNPQKSEDKYSPGDPSEFFRISKSFAGDASTDTKFKFTDLIKNALWNKVSWKSNLASSVVSSKSEAASGWFKSKFPKFG